MAATLNPVNFSYPPNEWDLERKKLERKQKMAEAMQARALQPLGPGVQAGQFFVPTSGLAALGQVLSSYFTKKGADRAEKDQEDSLKRERESYAKDLEEYFKQIEGTPGTPGQPAVPPKPMPAPGSAPAGNIQNVETFGLGELGPTATGSDGSQVMGFLGPEHTFPGELKPIDINRRTDPRADAPGARPVPMLGEVVGEAGQPAIPGTPGVSGDRRKAMMFALASQHGLLNQMGMLQMLREAEASGEGLSAKDYLKAAQYLDPATLPAIGAPEEFKRLGMRNDAMTVGPGQAITSKTNPQEFAEVTKGRLGEPVKIGGDLYQLDSATGHYVKMDNAPSNSLTVNMPKAESEYLKQRGKAMADDTSTAIQAGAAAHAMLPNIAYLKELNGKTSVSGPLADFALATKGITNMIGFDVDQQRLATDQVYRGVVNRQIVDFFTNAKGGAHGFTEMETKLLAQSYPQIDMNPKARAVVLDIMEAKMRRDIALATRVREEERKSFPQELGRIPYVTGDVPFSPANPNPKGASPWTAEQEQRLNELLQRSR